MSLLVLDASVAISWYLPEAFSGTAQTWRERWLRDEIQFAVPSLHYWEVANVLRTYVRRTEIESELAEDIFNLHLEAPFEQVEPDRKTVLNTAIQYGATAYDAVYIALALNLEAPLLTAERPTRPWVQKLGRLAETLR